jgi:predicted phage terminase large subunit-like protein
MIMDDRALRELDAALRLRFDLFLHRCFLTVNPGDVFFDNWHIDAMAHQVELVKEGKVLRLVANVPPRNLKSLTCNVAFSAFVLGHDPRKRIFCISYGSELAAEHSAQFKAIVQSDWYQRIFPRMRIKRIVDDDVYTTERGFRRWTSVMGAMTGMGGDLFIIDDPLKPIDALSDVKREAVNQWFSNTLVSRLDNKETAIMIVVMQRVHQDDLSGYLLRESETWTHLELPAIAEVPQRIPLGRGRYYDRQVDEVLHPAFESRETLQMLRREMGHPTFSAQYLQRPVPLEGALLPSEWFRYYTALPERDSRSYVLQSWDTAAKQGLLNSYSCCTTWLVHDRNYYLLHVLRQRLTYPALRDMTMALAEQYKPRHILIEDATTGTALAEEIRHKYPGVRLIKPDHDKQVRLFLQQAKFEQGRVWFPRTAPWLRLFLEELLSFPESKYSDQVDSVSQALAYKLSGYDVEGLDHLNSFLSGLVFQYCRW